MDRQDIAEIMDKIEREDAIFAKKSYLDSLSISPHY